MIRRSALLLLAPLLAGPALADPAPDVRLVIGGVAEGTIDAGLAIDLPEGWKTYWRTPGDAGIPPSIDASGSSGVAPIAVRFPAPERFDEAGLTAVGYTRSVILPIEARLADPGKPGRIALTVMIGLCRDICVPFDAHVEAEVAPQAAKDPAAAAAIAAARAKVPQPAEAGRPPGVARIARETGPVGPRLVAEVAMPREAVRRDVFVEGPTPEWALPQPERIGARGGNELWAFDLDGHPKDADLSKLALRFTLIADDRAVEQIVPLDARADAP
ncbi:MAG: hypothetical protein LWW93_00665 [Hyphomicrobiales bacterium]|nr:hypothetical protein [Hyphomicrobiales bacterium]